jgi:hypothetical protein
MLSNDQFATTLQTTAARLTEWAKALGACAAVDLEAAPAYWRLALAPRAKGACPVEVIVHRATQTLDLQVGPESFEALPAGDLADLTGLLQAVVDGGVTHRRLETAAGGVPVHVETEIAARGGLHWHRRRTLPGRGRFADQPLVARATHWLPYRRAERP